MEPRICRRLLVLSAIACALLASCSAPQRGPTAMPPGPGATAPPVAPAAPQPLPLTLEEYKHAFAQRVAAASADTFDAPVPPMLKSVVVLEVGIDRAGGLTHLSVYRSNGYASLERAALESVRHAAPFVSPERVSRDRSGSLRFLETFLFRDDGKFRIRSLVADSH